MTEEKEMALECKFKRYAEGGEPRGMLNGGWGVALYEKPHLLIVSLS